MRPSVRACWSRYRGSLRARRSQIASAFCRLGSSPSLSVSKSQGLTEIEVTRRQLLLEFQSAGLFSDERLAQGHGVPEPLDPLDRAAHPAGKQGTD